MLKNNESHKGNLIEAVRRGRENAIEYENLTSAERTWVSRLIFIYPWMKGSATFTGRFIRDHPIQAAIAYQLGDQARKYSNERFGPKPSYMEGIIPGDVLGLGKKQIVDPRGVGMFGSTADAIQVGSSLATGRVPDATVLGDFLTPPITEGAGYLFGFNPQSKSPLRSGLNPFKYLWETFGRSTPQAKAIDALRGVKPQPTSIMQRSRAEALARIGLGSIGPSTISQKNMNRVGAEEVVGMMSSAKRAVYYVRRDRDKMELALVQAKVPGAIVNGKLAPALQKAWDLVEQHKLATADIRRPMRGATKQQLLDYQRQALTAEIEAAIKLGLIDPSRRPAVARLVNNTTDPKLLKKVRRVVSDYMFGGKAINVIRKWAKENYGADL